MAGDAATILPPILRDVLCCPACHGLLHDEQHALRCAGCSRTYGRCDGIPDFRLNSDSSPYDCLYGQFDFATCPFGYDTQYVLWRKEKIHQEIARHIPSQGLILDNGGGYGLLRRFLDPKRQVCVNLDCSIEILKYDKSPFRCLGDGESLPFRNESFDGVVSADVLEHVADKGRYLSETYRVLRSGGRFILNTPRTGWARTYLRSPWAWILIVDRVRRRFQRKTRPWQSVQGVRDVPSDEEHLRETLTGLGYRIAIQSRTDNHLFDLTSPFWRGFADRFIDPCRYGHCAFFVCEK